LTEDSLVIAGGRRLAVRRIDFDRAGPALVFLHEGLGSIGQWQDFPERLSRALNLPALIYERYGHGASDRLEAPRDPNYLAEEALVTLPEVLERSGVRDAVLIGHSDGGSIALIYAGRHSPRAVVTLAAHVFVEEVGLDGIRQTVEAYESGDLKRRLERYHGDRTEAMFRGWAGVWLSPGFRGFRVDLSGVRCPVLALQGADDEYGTPEQLERIAAGAGGAVVMELIPGCGHAPHRQARDWTLERVKRFVDSQLRSDSGAIA
jgi:pimeloyl-ACP methyl ester carboxylesterase